ncbi:MAG: phosphopantetheine-binding protein [Halioglobus sp.]|nr:phosphopantetheine-binding protein [Halioglobus sp.]
MITKAKILEFIIENGGSTDRVEDDTPLFSSSLLDSFTMVSLIMVIESEADITIPPEDITLDNLDSINAILAYCEKST